MDIEFTKVSEYNQLSDSLKDILKKSPRFEFSILRDAPKKKGSDSFRVKHPNLRSKKPVFGGKVQFWVNYWRVNEKGSVETPILENPTWKDILDATNDMLEANDAGGIFLEGFGEKIPSKDGSFSRVELHFGS